MINTSNVAVSIVLERILIFIFCIVLFNGQVLASSAEDKVSRDCIAIKKKEVGLGVDFGPFKTALVSHAILQMAMKEEQGDGYTSELWERMSRLNHPQHREFLETQARIYENNARDEAVSIFQLHQGVKADDLSQIAGCVINDLRDINSDSYGDAIIALNRAILDSGYDIPRDEFEALVKKYSAEYETIRAAKIKRETARACAEKQSRENTVSSRVRVGAFEITANGCVASMSLGLEKTNLEPKTQVGTKFLVLDAAFKNVSDSSQYFHSGSLLINYNGKVYDYSAVEIIFDQRYGLPLTQINPLVSYRTKLVYRIPSELSGKVRWRPGDNPKGITVQCGNI